MENIDIRLKMMERSLRYKDVAKTMGITPQYFSKLLKHKMSKENHERVINAIESTNSNEGTKHKLKYNYDDFLNASDEEKLDIIKDIDCYCLPRKRLLVIIEHLINILK